MSDALVLTPIDDKQGYRVLAETPLLVLEEIVAHSGAAADKHSHDVQQIVYHLSGRFEVEVGDEVVDATAGTSYPINADVEHGSKCIEDGSYLIVYTKTGEAAG